MNLIKYFLSVLILMGTILFLVFVSDVIAKKYLGLGEPIVYDSHALWGYSPRENRRYIRFNGDFVTINNVGARGLENWREDGVNILMLHDPKLYWVEAYVDESQIRHVRVGQEVLIDLDAYPIRDFYGQVQHIGSVTRRGPDGSNGNRGGGSRLGGNVERVPVRISIENPPTNITPGMRGDVNIRIYENIKLWWKWDNE